MIAPPAVRPGITKNVSERLFEYTRRGPALHERARLGQHMLKANTRVNDLHATRKRAQWLTPVYFPRCLYGSRTRNIHALFADKQML